MWLFHITLHVTVQQGCVELRDWTKEDEVHFLAKRKKKGKKPQDMERYSVLHVCHLIWITKRL